MQEGRGARGEGNDKRFRGEYEAALALFLEGDAPVQAAKCLQELNRFREAASGHNHKLSILCKSANFTRSLHEPGEG